MTVFSKSDICYQILIERLLRGDGLCGAWTHHCPHPFRPLKGVQPSVVHILYATISSLGNVPGNEVAFLLSMTGKVPSLHPWSWVSPAINSPLLCQSPTRGLKSRQLTWTLLSLQEPLTAVPALPPMPQLPSQGGSIWGMKKAWPWEQAPLPIPPFLTVRNSGPLSAMVAHILNGDGNSEWQVLSPWGWEGPGRESGLSHMRGTMFPRHSPGWSTWHGGRGTVPGLKAC